MLARKFDQSEIQRLAIVTRTTITFERMDSAALPDDFLQAQAELRGGKDIAIEALSDKSGGVRDRGGYIWRAVPADEGGCARALFMLAVSSASCICLEQYGRVRNFFARDNFFPAEVHFVASAG